jgi:hypothetical protein
VGFSRELLSTRIRGPRKGQKPERGRGPRMGQKPLSETVGPMNGLDEKRHRPKERQKFCLFIIRYRYGLKSAKKRRAVMNGSLNGR